jgi:tRNA (guanine-N7-)-methyltransferase
VNGMAKALAAIDEKDLNSIRLHHGDAGDLVDWLPPASVERVDLLFPDPWPKRRHHKRRFISGEMLTRLVRVLSAGGSFRFATDSDDYAAWTLRHVLTRSDFEWTAKRAEDWRLPWPDWPGTRYEAKAINQGGRPVYLTFRRK